MDDMQADQERTSIMQNEAITHPAFGLERYPAKKTDLTACCAADSR